jgi:L-aminopeptidase/D-esterase-like protein
MITNDTTSLHPQTTFTTPCFEFDFPQFKVGVAEYEEGPTGCTVFLFPHGAATAIDIRGGLPGTVNNWEWNHALCWAGGSLYGLEASFGVAAELFAERHYSIDDFALVSGSIIFDYGPRENRIYPDKELGRAAVRAAQANRFPIGARGAGRSATCGWFHTEPSGQGAAFRQIGPLKIAVFSVFNCSGTLINRQGQPMRGNLDPVTGQRSLFLAEIERRLHNAEARRPPRGNTTLTVVVTNQILATPALTQFAKQVHTAMAQFIQPFHSPEDGDVLYAVTTGEVEQSPLDATALGAIAADLAWDAALSIC